MKRITKTYTTEKANGAPVLELTPVADTGEIEAIVSVFGNVDLQGDRVVKGAFSKSIAKWRWSGDPIPVIHSHQWGDPMAHIGKADPRDVEETESGLRVKYRLDLDNPIAAQVFRLMKERRMREHSFAYDVADGGERKASDGANELLELDIIEIGPTLKGANPDTLLLGVKSALKERSVKNLEIARYNRMIDEATRLPQRSDVGHMNVETFIEEMRRERARERAADEAKRRARSRLDQHARTTAGTDRTRVIVDTKFRVISEESAPGRHDLDTGADFVFIDGHLKRV